jgi:hypothetical protein
MAKSALAGKTSPWKDASFEELASLYEKRYSKMLDAMGRSK